MAPKASTSKANASVQADAAAAAEEPLQAIVIGDAYGRQRHWGPLVYGNNEEESYAEGSTDAEGRQPSALPWCLLPLLNQPLLAWTLEALASSGVRKTTVFVGDGVEDVRAWFAKSPFASSLSPMDVHIRYTTATSQGDVLRDADGLKLTTDFLLTQIGYVGNIDLQSAHRQFAAKRKADPNLVMDCLLAPVQPGTSSTALYAIAETSRLLHFEMTPRYPRRKRARLPREALDSADQFVLRHDLTSIGVDVCSADVPALFTENFDYQSLQPHFVNGILTSDLLGKTISCSVIGETPLGGHSKRTPVWATLVTTPRSYAAASDALTSRLVYPYTPDEDLPGATDRYEARAKCVYLGRKVELARTCTLRASMIGPRSTIDDDSQVVGSVLGESCSIGSGCTITSSYIFDGAHIAEGCTINASIIGRHTRIATRCNIEQGSIIGDGVRLGPRARLTRARVSRAPWQGEEGLLPDADLGAETNGHLWPDLANDPDAESDDEARDVRNYSLGRLAARLGRLSLTTADVDNDDDSASSVSALSRVSSSTSLAATHNDDPAWATEVADSFARAMAEDHSVDDAAVELKTMRMAFNVEVSDVRSIVVRSLARHADSPDAVRPLVLKWKPVLLSLRDNDDAEIEGAEDVLTLQRACAGRAGGEEEGTRLFGRWLRELYVEDVVSPEAVLAWAEDEEAVDGATMKAMRVAAQPLVDLCDESDDEEEDDEDDGSEE